jgi:phosphate:Na+ symporter
MAAIGASSTAKRLALAYVLFKMIAAVLALFPVTTPLLTHTSDAVDGVTLLAAYHTAYNIVGVLVLLPVIDRFTRLVERLLPERRSPLTRCLDPAALVTPIAAVEAARRTVARALAATCASIDATLTAAREGEAVGPVKGIGSVAEAADALRQAREFVSGVDGPPESKDEQRRLTSMLHALDHASRLTETAGDLAEFDMTNSGSEDVRAAQLCANAMRNAVAVAGEVAAPSPDPERAYSAEALSGAPPSTAAALSTEEVLARLEQCTATLDELQRAHRAATLGAVASGVLAADEAMVRVDTVQRLKTLSHHAWRSAAHLLNRGDSAVGQ